jgi:hypothetical protein
MGIIAAFRRVGFISNRMSHATLRRHWCDNILLNVYASTEERRDDMKDSCYEELEHVLDEVPKNHMKILLGDLNAKLGREDIFKLISENEILHEISNDIMALEQ